MKYILTILCTILLTSCAKPLTPDEIKSRAEFCKSKNANEIMYITSKFSGNDPGYFYVTDVNCVFLKDGEKYITDSVK